MLALHKGNRTAMKNAGLLAPLVELVALPKKGKKGKKKGKKGEAAVRVVTDEATTGFHAIGALRSLTLEDPLLKVAAAYTAYVGHRGLAVQELYSGAWQAGQGVLSSIVFCLLLIRSDCILH